MRGLVCLLVVAGCSESGVFVEVRVDEPAAEVELYFGVSSCTDCLTLTPEGARAAVMGRVLFRDADEPLRAPVEADGSAWFRFPVSPETVPTLVAIATPADGTEQPVAVAIVDNLTFNATRHVIIETEPAQPWEPDSSVQPAHGALVWPDRQCVAATNQGGQATFIVKAGDPDCDAVEPNLECERLVYLSSQSSTERTCVEPENVSSIALPGEYCVVGHSTSGCTDGEPPPPAGCETDGPIVGPRVCECAADVLGCILDSNELRIECTFMAFDDENGNFLPCPEGTLSSVPATLANIAATDTCISFAGFARAFSLPPTQAMFAQTIKPHPLSPHASLELFAALSPIPGPCIAGLQWSFTGLTTESPPRAELFAWVLSDLVSRPILVPMKVDWDRSSEQCTRPPTCTLVGDPRLP